MKFGGLVVVIAAACGGGSHSHPSDGPQTTQHDAAVDAPADAAIDAPADAPVDAGEAASMMIGSGGGTLTLPDGVALEIPAGALASDTMIGVRLVSGPAMGAVSNIYELTPDGTQLAIPARLTLPYDPAGLGSASADALTIATITPGNDTGTGWNVVTDADHRVSAFITHFSQWAIIPIPPSQGCAVNYSCYQTCTGAQEPELCCSQARGTCWSILHRSFPAFVSCYAGCIGTQNTTNFGNSQCMSSCCTSHGFTTAITGACYNANATLSDAQAVLDCARGCFGTSAPASLCGTGNIQFDACSWNVDISPLLGGECVNNQGAGVNSQHLATDVTSVYAQQWGGLVDITSGTLDATTLTMAMSCSNGAAFSGTASGTWNGFQYVATWMFGNTSGTMHISPNW